MSYKILTGNVLDRLKDIEAESVQCVVTSPPYFGLRNYGEEEQIGLEPTPEEYVSTMVRVFREIRRVLRDDGTVWLNLGDSYAQSGGSGLGEYAKTHKQFGKVINSGTIQRPRKAPPPLKPKDLIGIPWMVALALRNDGWYLRADIIWDKPNPMPSSAKDRPTISHEYIFLLTKSPQYHYDREAIMEPVAESTIKRVFAKDNVDIRKDADTNQYAISGSSQKKAHEKARKILESGMSLLRNKRSVWRVAKHSYRGAHFAVFPPKLIEPCVLAGGSIKACGKCGAPWKRDIEYHKPGRTETYQDDNPVLGSRGQSGLKTDGIQKKKFYGWKPGCECNTNETRKVVILDPFAGSGTTLQVAIQNGMFGLGIELNPDYVNLIHDRLLPLVPGDEQLNLLVNHSFGGVV